MFDEMALLYPEDAREFEEDMLGLLNGELEDADTGVEGEGAALEGVRLVGARYDMQWRLGL